MSQGKLRGGQKKVGNRGLLHQTHPLIAATDWPFLALEPPTGRTGTLAVTLGALTGTETGQLLIQANLPAGQLGTLTLAATGTLPIVGTLSQTLGALTLTATGGAVPIVGTLSQTLGALTASATGTLPIAGTLSATLGALTGSETGQLLIQANLPAGQLGTLTVASAATLTLSGQLAQTLGALTAVGLAELSREANLSVTLGELTLTATALNSTPPDIVTPPATGAGGGQPPSRRRSTLNARPRASSLSWTPEPPRGQDLPPINASLAATLGELTVAARATLKNNGAAFIKLDALESRATATIDWSAAIEEDDELFGMLLAEDFAE